MTSPRLSFFLTSLKKRLARKDLACPSCGSPATTRLDSKYGVVSLERCTRCQLMFRAPVTSAAESHDYYQAQYRRGFTTVMPDSAELERLKASRFTGTGKDFTERLSILRRLGAKKGGRLLDFGCSWGYGSWQLREGGFEVEGYEVSAVRCDYARGMLGISAVKELGDVQGKFDVIFSAHVLEHVPNIAQSIAWSLERLKPDGLFVAFVPNGSVARRRGDARGWHQAWGLDHPNLLDEQFFAACLGARKHLCVGSAGYASTDVDTFRLGGSMRQPSLDGGELMCACVT